MCLEARGILKHPLRFPSCCRSRLADFFTNCQPESRSVSRCLKENYADCLLAYSGLIGKTGRSRAGAESPRGRRCRGPSPSSALCRRRCDVRPLGKGPETGPGCVEAKAGSRGY